MPNRHACVLFASVLILAAGHPTARADTVADAETIKLEQEVDALSALNDLQLTADQLSQLKGMISDAAGTLDDAPAPITSDCKAALKALRGALLGKDQDKIDDAQDKVDDLDDKQNADSDTQVDQSEAAKEKAPTLLKMLTVKQVANFISQHTDDIDDPAQLLLDAIHKVRGLSNDDFVSLRDDTSDEIGEFFGMSHPGKPLPIVMKVNRLLMRAHALSDDEYRSQQSSLEDEARQLVGTADPIFRMRHWMESQLADVLSNPQLGQALSEVPGTGGK